MVDFYRASNLVDTKTVRQLSTKMMIFDSFIAANYYNFGVHCSEVNSTRYSEFELAIRARHCLSMY